PDDDVLLPTAYLVNKYVFQEENGNLQVDAAPGEGVFVMCDDYPNKACRLVLLPNPTRIVLKIGSKEKVIAWTAE
ncbi:MAG: hypothetical protein AAFQ98_06210, partial [Bacteroidota bacterium]